MSKPKHRDMWEAVEAMAPLDVLPWRLTRKSRAVRNLILKRFQKSGKVIRTLAYEEMVYLVRLR